jgi:hypothetical protein
MASQSLKQIFHFMVDWKDSKDSSLVWVWFLSQFPARRRLYYPHIVITECSVMIEALPHVPFAGLDVDSCCLEGTRVEILEQIMTWARSTSPNDPKIFWFTGPAGSGKTTIAHSIAKHLYDVGMLGSAFFFKRDRAEQSDPAKVITTLAHDMASHNLAFKIALGKVLKADALVPASATAQLEKLLLQPLVALGQNQQLCLLLDALDECGTQESRKPLLQALIKVLPNLPANVKLLATSRSLGPMADIDQMFGTQLSSITSHLELDTMENQRDILKYTQFMLGTLAIKRGLGPTWPGHAMTQKLAQSANGLFLWVYTACSLITRSYKPNTVIEIFISNKFGHGDQQLEALYTTAFDLIEGQNAGSDFVTDCCKVLGAIVTVKDPLPATALANLLGEDLDMVQGIIQRLNCLLEGLGMIIHIGLRGFR